VNTASESCSLGSTDLGIGHEAHALHGFHIELLLLLALGLALALGLGLLVLWLARLDSGFGLPRRLAGLDGGFRLHRRWARLPLWLLRTTRWLGDRFVWIQGWERLAATT